MKTNGKVSQFLKNYWHYLLFGVALSLGIFCGVRACTKHSPIDIDANRNRVVIQLPKA